MSPAKGKTPEWRGERGEASHRLGLGREGATAAGDGAMQWRARQRREEAEERGGAHGGARRGSTVLPSPLSREEKKGDGGGRGLPWKGELAREERGDGARAVRHGSGPRERKTAGLGSPSGALGAWTTATRGSNGTAGWRGWKVLSGGKGGSSGRAGGGDLRSGLGRLDKDGSRRGRGGGAAQRGDRHALAAEWRLPGDVDGGRGERKRRG